MKEQPNTNNLATILCDLVVAGVKARNAHWNVVAPNLKEMHELFGDIYSKTNRYVDDIAERMVQLGETPPATLASFIKGTTLPLASTPPTTPAEALNTLSDNYALIVSRLYAEITRTAEEKDWATNNLLMGIVQEMEKDLLFFFKRYTV